MENSIILPNNIQAEEELLSQILYDQVMPEGCDELSSEHFYDSQNSKIFEFITNQIKNNHPYNAAMCHESLGRDYFKKLNLILDSPPAVNAKEYCNLLINLSRRRKLIEISNAIMKRAQTENLASTTINYAETQLSFLKPKQKNTRSMVHMDNVYSADRMILSYKNYLKNLRNNRFRTGVGLIDEKIRGVGGGEVLTIIARAGSFKTALLQFMLKNYTAHSSFSAAFFSLEMPVPNITERFFCMLDGCGGREVEDTFLREDKKEIADAAANQFIDDMFKLYVVDTKVGIEEIKKYIWMIEEANGVKIGVIGIDYLGLINSGDKDEYQAVSNIARGVKDLAKELNIPVVLLSQVSRKGGDGEVEISLDMGRGSGAIEEAADFVIGLWQEPKSLAVEEAEYDLVAKILKNRKGPKNIMFTVGLNPAAFQFTGEAERRLPPKKTKKRSPGL